MSKIPDERFSISLTRQQWRLVLRVLGFFYKQNVQRGIDAKQPLMREVDAVRQTIVSTFRREFNPKKDRPEHWEWDPASEDDIGDG